MSTQRSKITPRVIIMVFIIIVVVPFLPLLISGRWDWWEAWVYAIISILGFAISRALVARRHPDLLAERARFLDQEDAKAWDKVLSPLVGIGGGLIPLVVGLDARFGWSQPFSMPIKIIGLVFILVGYVIASYALIANRFFSGMVRIQTERNQTVVSSGPYSLVRHPGYAGALLTYLGTPIFLDSAWAYLPVAFITIVLVIRTNLEDNALQEDLSGYKDYTRLLRYRLIPRVW